MIEHEERLGKGRGGERAELRSGGMDWSRAPWDSPADTSEASGFLGVVSSDLSPKEHPVPAEWFGSAPQTEDDPATRVVTRIGRAGGPVVR